MANHRSALKRVRSSAKRRLRNRMVMGQVRSALKQARALIVAQDVEAATIAVKEAVKAMDRAAEKGVLHKNNVARHKSRLTHSLNEIKAA